MLEGKALTMKSIINSKSWALFTALISVVFMSGCVGVASHSITHDNLPRFGSVLQQAPPIPAGQSRIVVYYPRSTVAIALATDAMVGILIENQQYSLKFDVLTHQGAFYCNVPAGSYSVVLMGSKRQALSIAAEPGKTYYAKVESGIVLVEESLALLEMKDGDIRASGRKSVLTAVPQTEYHLSESSASMSAEAADKNGLAELVVIRSVFAATAIPMKIGLDSKPGYPLWNKHYCSILASEGQHILTYSTRPPFRSEDRFWHGCKVELKKNKITYVRICVTEDVFDVRELTSQEAQEYLKKCKIGENGYLVQKL